MLQTPNRCASVTQLSLDRRIFLTEASVSLLQGQSSPRIGWGWPRFMASYHCGGMTGEPRASRSPTSSRSLPAYESEFPRRFSQALSPPRAWRACVRTALRSLTGGLRGARSAFLRRRLAAMRARLPHEVHQAATLTKIPNHPRNLDRRGRTSLQAVHRGDDEAASIDP